MIPSEVRPIDDVIYLACPYTSESALERHQRVEIADQVAAQLMELGYRVFSPLSHSHRIACKMYDTVDDRVFWLRQDEPFFDACDVMMILALPGWEQSAGIKVERQWAINHKMPTYLINIDAKNKIIGLEKL